MSLADFWPDFELPSTNLFASTSCFFSATNEKRGRTYRFRALLLRSKLSRNDRLEIFVVGASPPYYLRKSTRHLSTFRPQCELYVAPSGHDAASYDWPIEEMNKYHDLNCT